MAHPVLRRWFCRTLGSASILLVLLAGSGPLRAAGEKVVFYSGRDGLSMEVYMMDADGSNVVRLTFDDAHQDEGPDLSPDGTRIAWWKWDQSGGDIWLMDADGSNQRPLIDDGSFPVWDPTGTRLVYWNWDGIWVAHLPTEEGGEVQAQLIFSNGRRPSWSPDGQWIAFESTLHGGPSEVYLMRPDGSDVRRVTYDDRYDEDPRFSPNGHTLCYFSIHGSNAQGELNIQGHTIEFDPSNPGPGTNPRRLTFAEGWNKLSGFTPDGQRVLFSSARDGEQEDIYSMDLYGGHIVRLTNAPGPDRGAKYRAFSGVIPDPPRAPPAYSIVDLGVLPGAARSEARAVNGCGRVVGLTRLADGSNDRAFFWNDANYNLLSDPGEMIELGSLGGPSQALAVNEWSEIVGWAANKARQPYAVLWSGGTITRIGSGMVANALNQFTQVVGQMPVAKRKGSPGGQHAFLWQPGMRSPLDLGTLGGVNSSATGINDWGQVVGWAQTPTGASHCFLLTPEDTNNDRVPDLWFRDVNRDGANDLMRDLSAETGLLDDVLTAALSDAGEVAWGSWYWSAATGAVEMRTPGDLSLYLAYDLNNRGQAVGAALSYQSAFLWLPQADYGLHAGLYDLNALDLDGDGAPGFLNWVLIEANSISDIGQIAGRGLHNGQERAFLLIPRP